MSISLISGRALREASGPRANTISYGQAIPIGATGKPWKAVATIPTAELFAVSNSIVRQIALTGAASVLLLLGVVYAIAKGISAPLQHAVEVAKKIADGDLSVRLESSSRDEVGELQRAMGSMVDKLRTVLQEIGTSSDALTAMSREVASASLQMSEGTSEQAASVEQVSSSP